MNKNENDKFILEDSLNNLGFLVLGVFISSCYYRNFSAIDLLRRPIQIIGKYNENNRPIFFKKNSNNDWDI